MKNKKKTLFQSLVSLILCFSMLVGTTFAWFTDSVSSGTNIIATGNLDVEMEYLDSDGNWKKVDENTEVLDKDALWEPGHTEVACLKISNAGDLALKYALGIGIVQETGSINSMGESFKLSNYIEFGVVETESEVAYDNRIEARNAVTNSKKINEGYSSEYTLNSNGDVRYATLVVYMPEDVGNVANYATGANPPEIKLGIELVATQADYESDSFGNGYDIEAEMPAFSFPQNVFNDNTSADVTTNNEDKLAEGITIQGANTNAVIPAGVQLEKGTEKLTLEVKSMSSSEANVTLGENEDIRSLNVHVQGVSSDNDIPMEIYIKEAAAKGLNAGNLKLYHVENGTTVEMTAVDEFSAHNQFKYDPATGDITLYMATFSEIAVVLDKVNAWNGDIANGFNGGSGTTTDPYQIANADQLAYLNELVSSENGIYNAASYKLLSDIVFAGQTEEKKLVWYPIGYHAKGAGTNKAGESEWYTYGGAFQGEFDGAGHKISNIYQNTWVMDGNYDNGYWKEAMGLFGYVYGGTVKNLTIHNFYSEGEFAPTGCVAAYAANATFENIAITSSHPQTYNTSVAAIVGRDGKNGLNNTNGYNLVFRNITVDSTNTVSALWGSWDVGAAGVLGYLGSDSKVLLENCRVSPTIDVYNDVCGNYQYYWYRYCGMLIGTVDKTQADGSLDLSNITATNCTVDFGDRHEYYYCEFVKNSIASYTHDYQFSRVSNDDIVGTGDNATCKNHNHEVQGYETINDEKVLVEDKQAVYIPFRQVFGGYGWGVKGTEITEDGIQIEDITVDWTEEPNKDEQVKFESKFTGNFLYRVGNANTVSVGSLFAPKNGVSINDSGVVVSIDKVEKDANVSGNFKANTSDWNESTIQFSGTGLVKITIQDYDYCKPTELIVEVVDATNVPENGKIPNYSTTSVLLGDTSVSTLYLNGGATLYGNGFTIDCTNSPINGSGSVSENYIIALVDAHLNNVKVSGMVYPTYGAQASNDYNRALVVTKGNSSITNCYLSNTASPIRLVEGNLNVKGTIVKGGNFANIDIRNGHIVIEDVTTINQANGNDKASDGTTVIGLGIVVYYENVDPNQTSVEIRGTLTQNNLISQNDKFSHEYANQFVDKMMGSEFSAFQTTVDGVKWVNSGIITMSGGIEPIDSREDKDNYQKKTVIWSSNNGCLYTKKPNTDSISETPSDSVNPGQGVIAPTYSFDYAGKNYIPKTDGANDYCYYENGKVLISMDQGDTFEWDPFILTAIKNGKTLDYTVTYNGKTYQADEKVVFNTSGDYVVTYTYVDEDNYTYNVEGELVKKAETYTKTVNVSVSVIKPTTQHATFTFADTNTATEKVTVNDKTYISAKGVSATDKEWGYINVDGTKVFYPITEAQMQTSSKLFGGKETQVYYYVFKDTVTIKDYKDGGTGDEQIYNNETTTMPSNLTVVNGMEAKYTAITSACVDISKLTKKGADGEVWDFSASTTVSTTTNYNGYLAHQSPSGLTVKDGTRDYDAITVAQFSYTDAAGATYYYFIGYFMSNQNTSNSGSGGSSSGCFVEGTLITLEDGSQKPIEQITYTDELLAWDFNTGKYVATTPSLIEAHKKDTYRVINLNFSDKSMARVIVDHGFFDVEENNFVFINEENVDSYIGHEFVRVAPNGTYETVELIGYDISMEEVSYYSVQTAIYNNCIAENMFTLPSPPEILDNDDWFNYFEIGEGMKYDEAKMQADIEKYGLYTYEDFKEYVTYEQFIAFNGPYLKVLVGRGVVTYEQIIELIKIYVPK